MSNAYERLILLCENAGIPALPKSVAAAEMRGCSAGVQLLYDMLDRGLANVLRKAAMKPGLPNIARCFRLCLPKPRMKHARR